MDQFFKVVDKDRTEVRWNGEWFKTMSFVDVLRLTSRFTVARILERDDFAKRFAANAPISLSELLYPLMQAFDSVAVEADVELGGTDQTYNLLMGRDVMQAYELDPQVALTVELLLSFDGTLMSASRGNYIGLKEDPNEQFGKAMRVPDELLPQYYRLVMERGEPAGDPMAAKLELARFIVRRAWGEEAAREAEEHFTRVVRRHEAPEEVPEEPLPAGDPIHLPALLVDRLGVGSTSEARRLIEQGGVRLDGEAVKELDIPRARLEGATLQAGKRRFMRFRAG